jgi:HSP20 family protein
MHTYLWNRWSTFDFDVEDSDDATVLLADCPGMGEDDLEITVSAPYLIVRGEREARGTRPRSAFERRFWIGETYDPDRISAHVENGELAIRLEKSARARPRKIKLTRGGLVSKVKGLLGGDRDAA